MYDAIRVKAAFKNLIGHRQPPNPDFAQLSSRVTQSDSGVYIQDIYPLTSIETIDSVFEDFDTFDLPAWSGSTDYVIGSKVLQGGKAYISLYGTIAVPNHNQAPDPESTYWQLMFEDNLIKIQEQAALSVIDEWLNEKKQNHSTKALYGDVLIFDGAGRIPNTIIREGRFVGFRIIPQRELGITSKVNYIGFQLTQNQNFNLYVFHSSKSSPLYTIPIVTTAGPGNFQWISIDKYMPYYNMDQSTPANQTDAGCYFVGYFEDDIVGQAINKDYDFAKVPCMSCNRDMYNYWSQNIYNKFLKVEPITVNSSKLNGKNMWDIQDTNFVWNSNFGMNLKIDVCCEITDFIIAEKNRFTQAICKQMAIRIMNQVIYTNRENVIQEQQKKQCLLDLKGISESNFFGLESELKREIKTIDLDFSDLDSPCFRKRNKGLKSGSM